MERELWPRVSRLAREVGAAVRQKDVTFQPTILVIVLLWATLHDRSVSRACQPRNGSATTLRPAQLPSGRVRRGGGRCPRPGRSTH